MSTEKYPTAVDGNGNKIPTLRSARSIPELIAQWREIARRYRMLAESHERHWLRTAQEYERKANEVETVYAVEHGLPAPAPWPREAEDFDA